ncbi:hypothetical protein ACCQ08_22450 [Comamonas sp. SY3]|uniref:hypothetical protein n=1 Tax=Comamonas sp. SY3 TaxID=3243601 RepID=UPI0035930D08
MNEVDLQLHKSSMEKGGYGLNDDRFERLKQWHGVLFQIASASHYLSQLKDRGSTPDILKDTYADLSLFSSFILQYSKSYTSSGKGQVVLDAKKVFAAGSNALTAHERILKIRHKYVAHNDNSNLILANLGVKEMNDRFVIKHFLTLAIPLGELDDFKLALDATYAYAVISLNKQLDKLGEKLGKIVLLNEV